jgi:hypothetical protein
MLLSLVACAPTLGDLATTAFARLVRLSPEPLAAFRYGNHLASINLYPIDENGRQVTSALWPGGLAFIRFVQIAGLVRHPQQGDHS